MMFDFQFLASSLDGCVLGSLRFTSSIAPIWVFLFAALLSIAAGAYYLRETRHLAGSAAYLLPALRASAIFLVVLILAGPVWHRESTVGVLGRVIFALDTSASMSVTDSQTPGGTDRLNRMIDRLLGGDDRIGDDGTDSTTDASDSSQGWIDRLRTTHHIDVVAFDDGPPRVVWSSRDDESSPQAWKLAADGSSTQLSAPLRMAQTSVSPSSEEPSGDTAGAPPTALVIMSDGRDTAGRSSRGDGGAAFSVSSGSVVHTLGMGSVDEPADVGITRIDAPESVAVDGRLAGSIGYKQIGSDAPIKVRIETESGETVWRGESQPDDGGVIRFETDVASILDSIQTDDDRGVVRTTRVLDLRAVLDETQATGTIAENDSRSFRVAATIRDRRLLIVDGSSRWEIRYLRNLFERDPSYEVDAVIAGPGTDRVSLDRGDRPGQFPSTDEAMNRYDAVILGEIPPEQWTIQDAARLDQFVSRGGGLVVIDGRYDRVRSLSQGPLADLVPVEISSRSIGDVAWIAPTPIAADLPLFDLTGAAGDVTDLWKALPAPTQVVRAEVKPGAEVWLESEDASGDRYPVLVTRMYGSGRVFYFSSDQTWRWRYKVADQFHARFWNQLMTATMQPPYAASDDFVALATDKMEYAVGETPTIRARLRDASGAAVGDATVDAVILQEGTVVTTVPMEIDNELRGTYRGVAPQMDPGKYEIKIRAGGFDTRALRASMPFWIGGRPSDEWSRLSVDTDNLKRIASDGGGEYRPESSAEEIYDLLTPLSTGRIIRTDHALWQSGWWLAAVMALLAAEWLLRKRVSLV